MSNLKSLADELAAAMVANLSHAMQDEPAARAREADRLTAFKPFDVTPLLPKIPKHEVTRTDDWNEEFHPREPAGGPGGGQFQGGGDEGGSGGGPPSLSRPDVHTARLTSKVNPERALAAFPKEKLFRGEPPPDPTRAQERKALARVVVLREVSPAAASREGDAEHKMDLAKHEVDAARVVQDINPAQHDALVKMSDGYDYTMKQLETGADKGKLAAGVEAHWNSQLAGKGIDVSTMSAETRAATYQEHFRNTSGAEHVHTAEVANAGIKDMFAHTVPTPGIAYRGMKNVTPEVVERILNSKSFTLDSTSSFSFDHSVGHDYATGAQATKAAGNKGARDSVFGADKVMPNGVMIFMRVTHTSGVNMMGASVYKREHEVLMPKDARFRITGVTRGGFSAGDLTSNTPPHIIVDAEEI